MITLPEWLLLFNSVSQNLPQSFEDFLKTAYVSMHSRTILLTAYMAKYPTRNIRGLYNHIVTRNEYLTRFYNMSLRLSEEPINVSDGPLNNNTNPLAKNWVRSTFYREILLETQSGFKSVPTYMRVLLDLYSVPSVIDYKLLTPSAIDYTNNGRIGSVFSSFYFRASIMNPSLVASIRARYFPKGSRLLTPTLGWCSYLLGVSIMPVLKHYVGIDVIPRVCEVARSARFPNMPESVTIWESPSERLLENAEFMAQYARYFDAVFFSPPYYQMELYCGGPQSTESYGTYGQWLTEYWEKTVRLCAHCLRSDGVFTYIISPFGNYNLPADFAEICARYFVLRETVPIYNKNVNSTKHRLPEEMLWIWGTF